MPWTDPEKRRAYANAWYARNKERVSKQRNDWAKANREKRKETCRTASLKIKYGITPADWERMFETQGRKCGICECPEPRGGRWAVDHDHETGAVRGILCLLCNTALGKFEDGERLLLKALSWVRKNALPTADV